MQGRLDCLRQQQQLGSLAVQLGKQVPTRESLEQQKDELLRKVREVNFKLDDAKAIKSTISKQLGGHLPDFLPFSVGFP